MTRAEKRDQEFQKEYARALAEQCTETAALRKARRATQKKAS